MKLSLSTRIAEGFLSKEEAVMSLPELAEVALEAGFGAICMRASQVGVHSPPAKVAEAREIVVERGLGVSMVSGDFDIVYNNERGPACLRNIGPYLDLAEALGAPMVRVCIKAEDDLAAAREAADAAGARGLKLVHQCHVQSLFETADSIERALERIDRENFGLIFEAANLEQCGQDYGVEVIRRLAPWIANVYLQNEILKPDGAVTLETRRRGPVSFDIIQVHEPGGIDFTRVFEGLRAIGYDGMVTVHQSAPADGGITAREAAARTAAYLRGLMG